MSRFLLLSAFAAQIIHQTAGLWPRALTVRLSPSGDCHSGPLYEVQVAQTPVEQAQGLMNHLRPLSPEEGMLFVWNSAAPQEFWMKDTFVPLSLLYFGSDSTLLSATEMPVESDPQNPALRYPSHAPVSAALEIASGNAEHSTRGTFLCVQDRSGG